MAAKLLYPWLIGAYVYAIKIDGVVRYIGKGRRYRMIEHRRYARELNRRRAAGAKIVASHFHNRLAKAIRTGCIIEHIVLAYDLTDDVAFARERAEIAAAPPGQLWNIKAGGPEGDPEFMKMLWADPEHRRRFSEAIRKGKQKPEFREKARQTALDRWANPEIRARWNRSHRAIWDNPERAAERRALLKRIWSDPEKSTRKSALVKSQWTPERRAAMAENRRRAWADPAFKKRASESIRRARARERERRNGRSEDRLLLRSPGAQEV